jgi:hypothetical protein
MTAIDNIFPSDRTDGAIGRRWAMLDAKSVVSESETIVSRSETIVPRSETIVFKSKTRGGTGYGKVSFCVLNNLLSIN